MKQYFLFIFSFLILLKVYPQESIFDIQAKKDSLEFIDFLSYFDKKTITDYGFIYEDIPVKYYIKFFKQNYNENIVSVSPYMILNKSDNITLILQINYPEGGFSCLYKLATFRSDGMLLSCNNIGNNALDNDGGQHCEISYIDSKLLEIMDYNSESEDDNISKIQGPINYDYYLINDKIFIKVIPKYSLGRLYPQGSMRILSEDEMALYSKEQLDIIRNEIFADYGYIFQTDKWVKYFENKKWYKPRFEDVNVFLTEIEKINIDRILKLKEE